MIATIRLRRLTVDVSENVTRYYVRLPGRPKVRINGDPGSPEFMAEYHAAIAGDRPAIVQKPQPTVFAPRTLGRAIMDYYTSAAFEQLGPSRQHSRRLILNKLADAAGHEPMKAITKGVIQRGIDRRATTPSAANEYLKSLRAVFKYLISIDEVKESVAHSVPYLSIKTDGFHTWTLDEVAQFAEHHGTGSSAVLALALLLFTGQRRGDVIRMGPQHVKDGSIRLRQRKTGTEVDIPVLPPLQAVIDRSNIGNLNFIVTAFNRPFSDAGFGNRFRVWCDAAGLKHCTAHGLRKAGATIAANLGATDEQLMALFGWETRKQVSTYTRAADQKKLAIEAATRIAAALTANEIVPLSGTMQPGRDNGFKKVKEIKA